MKTDLFSRLFIWVFLTVYSSNFEWEKDERKFDLFIVINEDFNVIAPDFAVRTTYRSN